MIVLGLTGGIGCGKSTVVEIIESVPGFSVIDCDKLAKEVVEPGTGGFKKVVEQFGKDVLTDDGKRIDRKALGNIVFSKDEERKKLADITGPRIFMKICLQLVYHFFKGTHVVIIDAPTLYETKKLIGICAAVVVVACSPENQLERLTARDGISVEDAKKRIKSQMPVGMKIEMADHVFWNDADVATCHDQVAAELIPLLKAKYGDTKWHILSFFGMVSVAAGVFCMGAIVYTFLVFIFHSKAPLRDSN